MIKTSQNKRGLLIVVSGPSGVGKGTLVKEVLKDTEDFFLSVSATTRAPREGEVDGVSYFFMTVKDFEAKKDNNGFIEWAKFCENYYGTPADVVEDKLSQGIHVILEIEVQGAMKVKEKYPEAVSVFVLPPSYEVLKDRLVGRGTEPMDVIEKRLNRALEEIEIADKYDYAIVNDDILVAKEDFLAVVKAETLKTNRRTKNI